MCAIPTISPIDLNSYPKSTKEAEEYRPIRPRYNYNPFSFFTRLIGLTDDWWD